jgi:hypothetical protein
MTSKAIAEIKTKLETAVRRGKKGQTQAKNLRRRLRVKMTEAEEECADHQENELVVLESMYLEDFERMADVDAVDISDDDLESEKKIRKLARFTLILKPGESTSQQQIHVTAKLTVTYTPGK